MMSLENPCGLRPTPGRYIGRKMLKIFVDTLDKENYLALRKMERVCRVSGGDPRYSGDDL
jgi:hypothetical protein